LTEASVVFERLPAGEGRSIGIARLNRPRQLNALNLDMCRLLMEHLSQWASDESVVAVMLEGAGEKGFCAGGDVAEVVRQVRAGGPARYVYGDAFFSVEYQLDLLIHRYPKPLVAWIHGVCMGGGVGLAVGASHRIVAEGIRLAMPEIHIGLFPDVGGGWFLNRVPGAAGRVMALTGLVLNEADALHAGLADWFVPNEMQAELRTALSALDWRGDAREDRAAVTRLCAAFHHRARAGLPVSNLRQYADALRFIGMQPDVASLAEALQAAAREDPWFEAPAHALAAGSPTAAQVSFEYLRRTTSLSIAEVLAIDTVLARQFQRHPDFPEGVRALLIDKDRQPRWSVARFDQVPRALIEAHFSG
jgi:enoyl-CoA hydratase/carnithine racemase